MRKAGAGEDRKLLATDQRIQPVDSGNTGLYKFCRIGTGCRVHRKAVDIHMGIGENFRTTVNRVAHAVEDTAEHIFRNSELLWMAEEAHFRLRKIDTLCGFKELNNSLSSFNLKHFAAADLTVGQFQFAKFVICYIFNAVYDHQGACDFFYGLILFNHELFPPAATALISASISFSMAL